MADGRVGFAVIGSGLWGELHARVYAESPLAELRTVCDLDSERAAEVAGRYGVRSVTDAALVFSDPDVQAVSIVTPDFAHADLAIAAARAGKHILIEKPLATTVEECRQILQAVAESSVKLMVDFHNRWSPPFFRAKQAVASGELGEVQYLYYRLSDTIFVPTQMLKWAGKSTVEWFIGSHSLDTITWLLGELPNRVYAVCRKRVLASRGIATPDFYQCILEFPSGATAVLENAWILPESAPNIIDLKCEVVGSGGVLYIDGSHNRTIEKYTDSGGNYPDTLVLPTVQERQVGFAAESIRHFVGSVAQDSAPIVTGIDGLNVTKMILAIEESCAKREPVELQW